MILRKPRRSRSIAFLLGGLSLGLGACTDDGVENNPFNATDGATTGSGATEGMPDISASGMVSVGSGDGSSSSGSDDATSTPPLDDTGPAGSSTGIVGDESTTMGVLDTGTDD